DINAALDQFPNGVNGGQPAARVAGTGLVLTSSGEILTNNYVIRGATSISVTISGGDTHTATVIGADPADDVALLQVQGVSGLSTVSLASSSGLRLGQHVVAIGNALGQGGTPTTTEGVVVAVGRSINVATDGGGTERLTNLIEADASISPGDSGGALVNRSG